MKTNIGTKLPRQSAEEIKLIQENLKGFEKVKKRFPESFLEKETNHNAHYDNAQEFKGIVETLTEVYNAPYIVYTIGGGKFGLYKHKEGKEESERISFDRDVTVLLDSKNFIKIVKHGFLKLIDNVPEDLVVEENNNLLPSKYKITDEVNLSFLGHNEIEGCIIHAVHFTASKVKYDLNIPLFITRVGEKSKREWTRIYNVDSCFVTDK